MVNNGMFGTIRMHQEREYPGRVHGTDLVNPDVAAYARAALLELRVDPEAITPKTTLTAIRDAALARRGRA